MTTTKSTSTNIFRTFTRATGFALFIVTTVILLFLYIVVDYQNYKVDYIDQLPKWQYNN